ncbi:MAG: putative pre-16S rRNA nuclease [Herpetosiphonaceae bacterium]|nr:MAG: putative pre-16S rRNA nuclease [Herpetosiphonaceae bacterium]
MRVMALDVGGRRIGVAISDELRIIASPLTTIPAEPRPAALEQIVRLVEQHEVSQVVVGLPLTMRGEVGPQAQQITAFARALGKRLSVPIVFFDERFSSAEAERRMLEAGLRRERRKQRIDEIAAVVILQDYLESLRGGMPTLLPPDEPEDEPED